MAERSKETMGEEEMTRHSQEREHRSMAVAENIQPSQERRDLMRPENTQMLQGISQACGGALESATMLQQFIPGSGNLTINSPQKCTINILQQRQGATESDPEATPVEHQELNDSSQAAVNGRSLQPQTSGDERSVQGAHPTKDTAQAAAESCREALRDHYTTTGSYVQLIPWVDNDTKHIKDIFTELTLEESGKKLESYKDIFLQATREGNLIKRVILKGLPGRGKSTIMDKMAYDWACNEALQQFELVFVLRMSAVEQSAELIDSIFKQLLDEDTDIDKGALSSFISQNQHKVLILLDGFDELETPALDETLFGSILKMLNRKKDRDCYVVVTTRPSHYDKLVTRSLIEHPFTQVRVEGFDKEGIKKYVERFYSEEHDKAKGLLQKIESSNVLSDLAKSPMLLLLMCILWRDNSTLPETMSRIYRDALEYIFHRKTDMSPDEISKVTNELGKIGLNGLVAPKQMLAFPKEMFEPSVLKSAIEAGILTRQKVLKGMESHNIIQFLHKTFQEYCAGKYLQSLLETDPVQFKKTLNEMINSEGNDFEYVFRFCAGDNMACTNSILQTLIKKGLKDHKSFMQLGLKCYFESQSKDLPPVEFIRSVLSNSVVIAIWNFDSLNSLTYFLRNVCAHSSKDKQSDYLDKVQSLNIDSCDLRGCMSDLAYSMSLMVNLSSLTLFGCSLSVSSREYATLSGATSPPVGSAASWAHHFKKMKNLQKLVLTWCSGEDMTYIAPALCDLPNLVELNLDSNEALGGTAASWAHHFKKMKNLQKLYLHNCSLTGEDMTALCDLPNLVELHLSRNKALGGSAASWAHHFKKMKNLQKLVLSECSLTGEDMTHMAPVLCDLPNLVELSLVGNKALSGSAASWTHHFKKMKNLQKLVLSELYSLTGEDMTHIVPALCDLPNLVELDLGGNGALGAGSVASWAHHFKKMKNLQKLVLSWCSLTGEDMTHMAPALCDLPNLVELNLESNKALGGTAASWAHQFKKMKNIQKLVLSWCSLTGEDMTHMAPELCDLPNLVELDLHLNEALGGTAASWAHHFKKMKNLQKLVLSWCSLTGEDMTHIASALCDLPNLVELHLYGNRTLGGSAASWAHHFKKMKNLQKLHLSGCSLTGEDTTHIVPALRDLPKLIALDIQSELDLATSRRCCCII